MNKKKKIIIGTALFGLIGALFTFMINDNQNVPASTANADETYVLHFAPFGDGATYGSTTTQNGNTIAFYCTNYHTSEGNWGYLSGGGSLYNIAVIAGIKSMTLEFYDNTSSGTMNWRWDYYHFQDETLALAKEEFDSSENLTKTLYFQNEGPK